MLCVVLCATLLTVFVLCPVFFLLLFLLFCGVVVVLVRWFH